MRLVFWCTSYLPAKNAGIVHNFLVGGKTKGVEEWHSGTYLKFSFFQCKLSRPVICYTVSILKISHPRADDGDDARPGPSKGCQLNSKGW